MPAVRSLDDPAAWLLVADRPRERWLASPPDVAANAALPQIPFGLGVVVPLVEAQVLGSPRSSWRAKDDGVECLADHVQVGDVGGRQGGRQRNAAGVGQNVALGAELSTVTRTRARVLPPFGAFTMTLSREHQARSAPTVP